MEAAKDESLFSFYLWNKMGLAKPARIFGTCTEIISPIISGKLTFVGSDWAWTKRSNVNWWSFFTVWNRRRKRQKKNMFWIKYYKQSFDDDSGNMTHEDSPTFSVKKVKIKTNLIRFCLNAATEKPHLLGFNCKHCQKVLIGRINFFCLFRIIWSNAPTCSDFFSLHNLIQVII